MTHIMLDLETLGTKPGCVIASVGACAFDMDGVEPNGYRSFYNKVDIRSSLSRMLTIDAGTVAWWMAQSAEAREIFNSSECLSLEQTLYDFVDWCSLANEPEKVPNDRGPILQEAYDRWGNHHGDFIPRYHGTPWKFYNVRDTRTLYALAEVSPDRVKGTHHNALDDAKAQALAVIEGYKKLGKTL